MSNHTPAILPLTQIRAIVWPVGRRSAALISNALSGGRITKVSAFGVVRSKKFTRWVATGPLTQQGMIPKRESFPECSQQCRKLSRLITKNGGAHLRQA